MDQKPFINTPNKEEYPPMHTGRTDASLKCNFFICALCFALVMWCSPCQSSFAQAPNSIKENDEHQESIAQNKDYYMYILALDNKILKGGNISSSLWDTSTRHIMGSVVDATNNRPIENVKLELLRKDDSSFVCSTTTNSDGKYGLSFPQLTHDDGSLVLFLLRITADGYQSLCLDVDMSMIIEYQSIFPPIPCNFSLNPIDKEVPYNNTKGTEQKR